MSVQQETNLDILERLKNIENQLGGLSKLASIAEELQTISSQIKKNEASQLKTTEDIQKIKEKTDESQRRGEWLEKEAKQSNLIFYNFKPLNPPRGSLAEEISEVISGCLPQIEIRRWDINDAFRLNTKKQGEIRPVLVKFTTKYLRDLILRNSVRFQSCGISLAPDYTRAERIARNALKPLLQKAIKEDREVKFRGPRLFADDELFTYDQESENVRQKWKS